MAQLVALMSGVVLGGVAEVVGSNLARGKIFTASIGSVDSLYSSVYIYIYIYINIQYCRYALFSKNSIFCSDYLVKFPVLHGNVCCFFFIKIMAWRMICHASACT